MVRGCSAVLSVFSIAKLQTKIEVMRGGEQW